MDEMRNDAATPGVKWPEPYTDHYCQGILHRFKTPPTKHYQKLLNAKESFHYDIQPNFDFDLRFYFPSDVFQKRQKADHLIIMFNGLDEFLPDHLTVYNRLGSQLALQGMASVLFPTPFHMNRAPVLKSDLKHSRTQDGKKRPDIKRPSEELIRNPFNIYMNFIQTLHEYDKFKRLLSPRFRNTILTNSAKSHETVEDNDYDQKFYERYFKEDVLISLLGYSLGGLKALSCFKDNPDHPKSCILLNSGATVDRIQLKGIMDNDQWRAVTDSIVSDQYPSATLQSLIDRGVTCWRPDEKTIERARTLMREVRNDDKYAEVRKVLIRSRPFDERDRQVLSRKLFLLIGGRDKIIPPEAIRRLEPEGSSLNVLHISDLGHFPDDDAAFNRWCAPVMGLLVEFIKAPEGTSLSKTQVCSLLFSYDWLCGGTLLSQLKTERINILAHQTLQEKLEEFTGLDKVAKEGALIGFAHTLDAWQFNFPDAQKRIKELKRYRKKNGLLFGDIVVRNFGYDEISKKEIENFIAQKPQNKQTGVFLTETHYITEKQVYNVLREQGEAYRKLMEEFPEGREWLVPIIKTKLAAIDSNRDVP